MKEKIHPAWYPEAQVICACGNVLTVGATKQMIKVEVCSRCHPFFSGEEQRIVDTEGRVERLKRKYKLK